MRTLHVLIVEDSEDDADLTLRELRKGGFEPVWQRVDTAADMGRALEEREWDVVLSDYSMPQFSAPDAFVVLRSHGLDTPFIIVSGTVGEEAAVAAMRLGVQDYLIKGKLGRLVATIERELREHQERKGRRLAEENLRKTQQQLYHAQKIEAIGRLAAGVAHDFNNLLSVVLSYAGLILESLKADDPVRADVIEIRKAGERATALTRQLLAFSRQQVLAPRVLDVNQLLASMEKMVERLVGEDVDVAFVRDAKVGRVRADPGQLEQVVMNLVVNARDAMPDGGQLTIETKNVQLDDAYAQNHPGVSVGAYVLLSVRDTGLGIDHATQERIFEPFFTTKEQGKGTGLGLSTVFGIVQQSGGHVGLHSEPGKGATFNIYLPRTDADEECAPSQPSIGSLRGTETVLLVEDDPQLRVVSGDILRRHGYRVLSAADGSEALVLCEERAADIALLLTDVVLPKVAGRQLAQRVRSLHPDVKVVFMSGHIDEAVRGLDAEDSGVTYLQKPFTPEALARKLREALNAGR